MKKYQLTKTIRFKLDSEQYSFSEEIKAIKKSYDETEEISHFGKSVEQLSEKIKHYLFIKQNGDTERADVYLNANLEIKYNWLKQHTKEYCYSWDARSATKHRVSQVKYLKLVLVGWHKNWCDKVSALKVLLEYPLEKQARRAEFALLIAEFSKREVFYFIRDFVQESQDKSSDKKKNELLILLKQIEGSLANCQKQYMPGQSRGLVIARASLNYYTINKKPRDYPKEIKERERRLKAEIENKEQAITREIGKRGFENEIRDFVIKRIFKEVQTSITLDSLYQEIKIYKSREKKRFEEAIDRGASYDEIQEKHCLFVSEERYFNDFVEQTNIMKEIGNKLANLDKASANYHQQRQKLKKKSSEAKQKRGKDFFFIGAGKKSGATKYKKFCELYKVVAMKRGKIVAEIKGIEREKIDSQLLNYWAVIIEKDKKHQLVLIPKQQAQTAYQKLNNKPEDSVRSIKIHYFKSLTLRALKKLCFGTQGNSFAREIKDELSNQFPRKYDQMQGAFSFEKFSSEADIVKFYQAVLSTRFVKDNLDIHDFEELDELVADGDIATLNDFEEKLEKICYKKRILAGESLEAYLRDECSAKLMKITSYDLRKKPSRKGKDKAHTTLWKQFWSQENVNQKYPTRLNPELKIIWRDAKQSRVNKYGENSSNYDASKNNRYLQPQFTMVAPISWTANQES